MVPVNFEVVQVNQLVPVNFEVIPEVIVLAFLDNVRLDDVRRHMFAFISKCGMPLWKNNRSKPDCVMSLNLLPGHDLKYTGCLSGK